MLCSMWHPAEDLVVTVAMSSSLSTPLSTLFWASVEDPILKLNMAQKVLLDFLYAMIAMCFLCMRLCTAWWSKARRNYCH